jgi:DNA-damage-inducible protein J
MKRGFNMSQNALIQVRVDKDTKRKADLLFSDLGFDTPTAIRIFLNQAIKREGMPFEVAKPQPNAETLAAMLNNMERHPKSYNSFREIINEIDAEIAAEEKDVKNDPLCFEDFNRSELAIDIIATMLGFNLNDAITEEAKDNPDHLKLNKLKKQEETLIVEQEQIYYGNKEVMAACIEKYAPVIRARYDNKTIDN